MQAGATPEGLVATTEEGEVEGVEHGNVRAAIIEQVFLTVKMGTHKSNRQSAVLKYNTRGIRIISKPLLRGMSSPKR